MIQVRKPIVAGQYYPNSPATLLKLIKDSAANSQHNDDTTCNKTNIIGGVVPHGSYINILKSTINFFQLLRRSNEHFDTVVIISSNSSNISSDNFNCCDFDKWQTPVGLFDVDNLFRESLNLKRLNLSHIQERAIEIQLPLLKFALDKHFKIVPILINKQEVRVAKELARRISDTIVQTGRKTLVLATGNLNNIPSNNQSTVINFAETLLNENNSPHAHLHATDDICPTLSLIAYSHLFYSSPHFKPLTQSLQNTYSHTPFLIYNQL